MHRDDSPSGCRRAAPGSDVPARAPPILRARHRPATPRRSPAWRRRAASAARGPAVARRDWPRAAAARRCSRRSPTTVAPPTSALPPQPHRPLRLGRLRRARLRHPGRTARCAHPAPRPGGATPASPPRGRAPLRLHRGPGSRLAAQRHEAPESAAGSAAAASARALAARAPRPAQARPRLPQVVEQRDGHRQRDQQQQTQPEAAHAASAICAAASRSTATIRDTPRSCIVTPISC